MSAATPPYVFSDLASAIQFCKRFKEQARFRELSSRAAAEQFSLRGDVPLAIDGIDGEQCTDSQQLQPSLGSPLPGGQGREDRLKLIGEKSAFRWVDADLSKHLYDSCCTRTVRLTFVIT